MFFTKHFLNLKKNDEMYFHKNLLNKFIDKYIELCEKQNEEHLDDAVLYSKFYYYYKFKNCIYHENIMKILIFIDNEI